MPRTAGTYAIPAGTLKPAVAGSPASAADFNAFIADLEDAITDSLSRTGNGGMSVPMEFTKGTDAAPGITFAGDTNTGVNSDTADVIDLVAGGVAALNVTATGVTVPGTLGVTGNATVTGNLTVTGTYTGPGGTVNYEESTSSGTYSTVSTTTVDVTNLAVTITTTGRPILVGVKHSLDIGARSVFTGVNGAAAAATVDYQIYTGTEEVVGGTIEVPANSTIAGPASFSGVTVLSAGTHTFKVAVKVSAATTTANVKYMALYAVEL